MKITRHLLAAALAAICAGCGDDSAAKANGNDLGFPEPGKGDRILTLAQAQAMLERALIAKLPDYLENLSGVAFDPAGEDDPPSVANWNFVVPRAQIPAFEHWLVDRGVPPEHLRTSTLRFGYPQRDEDWQRPDPPIRILRFTGARQLDNDGTIDGLFFPRATSLIYGFDNPNWDNSMLYVYYSWENGNVHIDHRWLGD